ncbi:MarR family winged helix-turn-helix transcriptional regulator [Gallaecimonas mangrovi]|uniref:MarR family winged helix-turn-helix transcriptional regulator n=1 Tax=Gallaecimonas mangrovi TaxID=2291597 RepID=UPI000E20893A|nr:MarR family transcriptional regulator [Gallaecimonas mangrovi]
MKKPAYTEDNFTTGDNLGYLLKTSHNLLHEVAQALLKDEEISFLQWLTLFKLQENSARTASDLAKQLRHDNGALTRCLDKVEQMGFLERRRSEQDRRVVELHITDKGRAKVKALTPVVLAIFNEVLSDFTDDEFHELNRLLKKLKLRLSSLGGEQGVRLP